MYIFRKNLCVKMMICQTADRGLNGDWTNKRLQGKEIDSVEVCPDKYPIKPFPLCPHLGLKDYRVDVCTGRRQTAENYRQNDTHNTYGTTSGVRSTSVTDQSL
jgi:hypothetical protein